MESNLGLTLRAEKLNNQRELFVETVHISSLLTSSNQLIYGRRGAGKTILLKALHETLSQSDDNPNIYSLFYTATDFRSSPDGSDVDALPTRTLAHRFFHSFVTQLVDDVLALTDSLIGPAGRMSHLSAGGLDRKSRRSRIDRLGLDLLEASGYGTDTVDLRSGSQRSQDTVTSSRQRSGSAGAEISLHDPKVSVGRSRSSAEEHVSTVTTERAKLKHFEPHRVRASLRGMLELLNIDYLVIFIDEWMSLAECQAEFAERLKQCLFGEPSVAVKIAADQYQGGFNNSQGGTKFRGLEVGADIFVAEDLDEPFRDPIKSRARYAEALYRRLVWCEPGLTEYFGPVGEYNEKYFLSSLFATPHTFETLCYSSQGVCRTFFEIFEFASREASTSVSSRDKIDLNMLRRAILTNSKEVFKRIQGKVVLSGLYKVIEDLIDATNSRYFVMPTETTTHDDLIRELLQMRMIHGVERSILDPSIRAQYRVFEIDFGVSVDTQKATEWATGKTLTIAELSAEASSINAANVEKYILDLQLLRRDDYATCEVCSLVFPASTHCYVVKGYCPECVEPAVRALRDAALR